MAPPPPLDRGARLRDSSFRSIMKQFPRQGVPRAGLHWSEADIDSVTAYVAQTYYKLPAPASR